MERIQIADQEGQARRPWIGTGGQDDGHPAPEGNESNQIQALSQPEEERAWEMPVEPDEDYQEETDEDIERLGPVDRDGRVQGSEDGNDSSCSKGADQEFRVLDTDGAQSAHIAPREHGHDEGRGQDCEEQHC